MGYFDDIFKSEFFFDSEHRQRSDIENLKATVASAPNPGRLVEPLRRRVDQLELLCKALTELVISKGVATREELSVVTQQLDLEDGREDGKISKRVRKGAPRCPSCDRFVNPRRETCVYCHTSLAAAVETKPPAREVVCGGCTKTVPESDTFYTASGLRCSVCYAGNS